MGRSKLDYINELMDQTCAGTVEEWSKGVKRVHLSTTKWGVDWGAMVVASLANRSTVTTEALENVLQHIKQGCTKLGFARKRSTHPDFYGPNITDGPYRVQLTEALQTGQAMGFDNRGDVLPSSPLVSHRPTSNCYRFCLAPRWPSIETRPWCSLSTPSTTAHC